MHVQLLDAVPALCVRHAKTSPIRLPGQPSWPLKVAGRVRLALTTKYLLEAQNPDPTDAANILRKTSWIPGAYLERKHGFPTPSTALALSRHDSSVGGTASPFLNHRERLCAPRAPRATELPCGQFGVPLPSPHAPLHLEKDNLRVRTACTACTACHRVTLWSVWSAPPLPARASPPRDGHSPCAHRVHRVHGIPARIQVLFVENLPPDGHDTQQMLTVLFQNFAGFREVWTRGRVVGIGPEHGQQG